MRRAYLAAALVVLATAAVVMARDQDLLRGDSQKNRALGGGFMAMFQSEVLQNTTEGHAVGFVRDALAYGKRWVAGEVKLTCRLRSAEGAFQVPDGCLVAIVPGYKAPARAKGSPWVVLEGQDNPLRFYSRHFYQASDMVDALVGQPDLLPPFRIAFDKRVTDAGLLAVYELGPGRVTLAPHLAHVMEDGDRANLDGAYDALMLELQHAVQVAKGEGHGVSGKLRVLVREMAHLDISKMLAHTGALCIACVVLLAIGLPLAANFLFYAIAEDICHEGSLSPDECRDLVLGGVLLAELLLPFFAYAIFKLCKLRTCANTRGYMVSFARALHVVSPALAKFVS